MPPDPTPPPHSGSPDKTPTAKSVSIRDLARRLRVNHSTVSRALRNDPRITPAVREQVHALANELHYRPDPMLSALASYRQRRREESPVGAELAWINAWPSPQSLRAFHEFDLYWRGAASEAEHAGFRLTEFVLDHQMSAARLAGIFRVRNIRGILIPPHGAYRLDWTGFPWDEFSLVRFGHSVLVPRVHLVTSNQVHNGALAFHRAREKGYRRVGLVISEGATTLFAAGYFLARMREDPACDLPPLQLPADDKTAAAVRLEAWLRAHRPDAILTDYQQLPTLLARLGLRVPQDLGLAAFSVLDGGGIDAGIDQNAEEIGRSAFRLLASLLLSQERGLSPLVHEILIEGRWVDGASLPGR